MLPPLWTSALLAGGDDTRVSAVFAMRSLCARSPRWLSRESVLTPLRSRLHCHMCHLKNNDGGVIIHCYRTRKLQRGSNPPVSHTKDTFLGHMLLSLWGVHWGQLHLVLAKTVAAAWSAAVTTLGHTQTLPRGQRRRKPQKPQVPIMYSHMLREVPERAQPCHSPTGTDTSTMSTSCETPSRCVIHGTEILAGRDAGGGAQRGGPLTHSQPRQGPRLS